MGKVMIYTDGAARGNPDGPGGYGTILQYTDKNGDDEIIEKDEFDDDEFNFDKDDYADIDGNDDDDNF